MRLSPLVVLLDADMANKLLDSGVPELALCAAWAVRRRRGPRAKAIVERAIEVTEALPEPLRFAQLATATSVAEALANGTPQSPSPRPRSRRVNGA